MHVEVAAQMSGRDQLGERARGRLLDLILAMPQLRRDEGQTQRPVNVRFGRGRQELISAAVQQSGFREDQPRRIGVLPKLVDVAARSGSGDERERKLVGGHDDEVHALARGHDGGAPLVASNDTLDRRDGGERREERGGGRRRDQDTDPADGRLGTPEATDRNDLMDPVPGLQLIGEACGGHVGTAEGNTRGPEKTTKRVLGNRNDRSTIPPSEELLQ